MSIDVEISAGNVCALPVHAGTGSQTLLTGPAYLCGWSLREASGNIDLNKEGSVVAPGAVTNIVSLTGVPPGKYTVNVVTSLQGAAAAGDANNFQLSVPGGQTEVLVNPGAAGNYPQDEIVLTTTLTGAWNVRTVGAGTAGVTYSATIELLLEGEVVAVAEIVDGNNPLGEISCIALGVSNAWFGRPGLWVRNQIALNIISGALQGAVYAAYPFAPE